jgi:hypothetical protein
MMVGIRVPRIELDELWSFAGKENSAGYPGKTDNGILKLIEIKDESIAKMAKLVGEPDAGNPQVRFDKPRGSSH